MHEATTLLRRDSGTGASPARDEGDPVLAASIRNRVAAFAALAAVAYSVAVPLDLAMHAGFATSGLTSPARLKNVVMAALAWSVYLAARKTDASLGTLTRLACFMVFSVGLHQTLEALHFFQWSDAVSVESLASGAQPISLVDGLPWTCLLMALFPPFVPGSPSRHLLLALSLALPLLALPVGWSLMSGIDYWAILSPETFANVPLSVVLSLFMSIAIHRIDNALREERRRSRELGSYELLEELGHGGMGEVWLARHKMLARPAALKLIKSDRIRAGPEQAANALRRFEREARATAHLRSTHTVELYDFGRTDAGDFYYVMELLDGMDLDALVRRDGPQPAWRVVRMVRQRCLSLAEAHEQGLIHRDIKPANIFLCRQGAKLDIIKVLDFGLVTGISRSDRDDPTGLTREDEILGTPAFMAPEMAVAPDDVDHRADLYAVGCVAYWLLAGRHLFDEDTVVALMFAHVHKAIPSPLFAKVAGPVPGALEALLTCLLAKSPTDRPQSAREVLRLLDQIEVSGEWDEGQLRDWWSTVAPPPTSSPRTRLRNEVVPRPRSAR
ncbi:MAG: serine/threonine protein kinase [Acidobacteria bacterium]|nr:serine/threonine protein kinase [Acidobacteriota bacterium]